MEEKFLSVWAHARAEAEKLGVRLRPMEPDLNAAHRILSGRRLSDGFSQLEKLHRLDLSLEALAVSRQFTALFSDEEANEALNRLLEVGYTF